MEGNGFDPKWDIKTVGHVTAEFKGAKNAENLAAVFEWIKREKWRGCLEINFVGNGGVNCFVFREEPRRMVEQELPY